MSTLYVSSVDGNDADNGSTWALAKGTVAGALAIAGDLDIIFVDSAHNFSATSANILWDAPTAGFFVAIISVNRNGSTTTGHSGWLAGATETCGTNNFSVLIASARAQRLFIYGMSCVTNTGVSNTNQITIGTIAGGDCRVILSSCTLTTPFTGAATSPGLVLGCLLSSTSHVGSFIRLLNCTCNLPNTASVTSGAIRFSLADKVEIIGITIAFSGANKPTVLFGGGTTSSGWRCGVSILDSDLSGFNAGTYFSVANAFTGFVQVTNCKLHATPALVTGTWPRAFEMTLINTDSGDTKTVFEYRNRLGTIMENASIYANASAQMNGTSLSWEIVTTSACNEAEPFVTPWLHAWGDSTSAQNAGFRLIHDSATNLHNRNCWADIEYASDASFPKGTLGSTRNATPFDGSSADLSSDSETWTGTGGFANPNKQKADVNFTPAEKSMLRGRLSVGIASKTLYMAPQLWLS